MEQKVEKQASLESVPVKRLKRELKYQGTILKLFVVWLEFLVI